VIRVADVCFDYPSRRALDDVSFILEKKTVTALVGPNGAGKSTLMRLLAALERPRSGSMMIGQDDVHADPRRTHRRVGFLPDNFGLYDELSVRDNLRYRALAQGMEKIKAAVALSAERTGLSDRLREKAAHLSRGLRQRLGIALAILHEPDFLILDEPASGLDPAARADLSGLLRALHTQDMTILVSSHILSELEDYSTHMLAIEQGRVLAHEPLAGREGERVPFRLELAAPHPDLAHLLEKFGGLSDLQIADREAHFCLMGDATTAAKLVRHLVESGVAVSAFAPHRKRLQDSYLIHLSRGPHDQSRISP
jgi:ABC-2 type transport system ATP-binding protein